jgi:hypothetical protein
MCSAQENVNADQVQPFYIQSIVFLLPYLVLEFLWGLNIWYLCDEVEYGGVIAEPGGSATPLLDLSHISVQDSCIFIIALPIGTIIQVSY